jgi:hypothetical protein
MNAAQDPGFLAFPFGAAGNTDPAHRAGRQIVGEYILNLEFYIQPTGLLPL